MLHYFNGSLDSSKENTGSFQYKVTCGIINNSERSNFIFVFPQEDHSFKVIMFLISNLINILAASHKIPQTMMFMKGLGCWHSVVH